MSQRPQSGQLGAGEQSHVMLLRQLTMSNQIVTLLQELHFHSHRSVSGSTIQFGSSDTSSYRLSERHHATGVNDMLVAG